MTTSPSGSVGSLLGLSDKSPKDVINDYNRQMRSQPWYQDWFAQRGLNPNSVKLTKDQRKELESQIVAHGAPAAMFNDLMIDPAGNLNHEHGFASQPTWLKALEIGGAAAVGAIAAPGSVGSLFGLGGGSAPTTGTMIPAYATSTPAVGAFAAVPETTLAASGGVLPGAVKAAAKTGFSLSGALAKAAPALINAGTNLYGQHAQIAASDRAAQIQSESAKYATDAQTKANDAALEYQRQQALHADQVAETDRHANYDQWAASQRRLQSVGDLLGAGPREIPAYVPTPQGSYGSVGATLNGGMVTMVAPDGSQKAVASSEVPYWASKGAKVAGRA